jgi:2-keto-4-pentenoate hydratase/2-oxohepta-3-ene-1,7-dioic acid hydratase in catechol pathway
MRLVTYNKGDGGRVGALTGNEVVDIREARTLLLLSWGRSVEAALIEASRDIPGEMNSFIMGGDETLMKAKEGVEYIRDNPDLGSAKTKLRDLKLEAPIPHPPMVLNMGNAYRPYSITSFTQKPITGVIGPDEPIIIPEEITDFGAVFECEIGVVIGKRGRRIPGDERAYDRVYGYMVYNDITDYGKQIEGRFDAKLHDTFCPMGPCIATRDEVEDPYNLFKRVWVNGQLACETNTEEMKRGIPEFLSVASRTITLLPGTVISTGTPAPGRIKPGDIIEMEITQIGKLKNPVIAER